MHEAALSGAPDHHGRHDDGYEASDRKGSGYRPRSVDAVDPVGVEGETCREASSDGCRGHQRAGPVSRLSQRRSLLLFLVIILATLVVLLPYSNVGGRDARRSRGLLLGASAAVLLVSVVIRAALAV